MEASLGVDPHQRARILRVMRRENVGVASQLVQLNRVWDRERRPHLRLAELVS